MDGERSSRVGSVVGAGARRRSSVWLRRRRGLALIGAVAARHGGCESLLFTWRRQVREDVLAATPEMPVLMPVHMIQQGPGHVGLDLSLPPMCPRS
jgi:hypothetical protein